MNRSKGTYLQGLQHAEKLMEQSIDEGQDPSEKFHEMILKNEDLPSYYYDGNDYCEGFYDYIDYYLDNEELIVNRFREFIQNAKS